MWVLGGRKGGDLTWSANSVANDVWTSRDGRTWALLTANSQWSKRAEHSALVYKNAIWIMGGSESLKKSFNNDVWKMTISDNAYNSNSISVNERGRSDKIKNDFN